MFHRNLPYKYLGIALIVVILSCGVVRADINFFTPILNGVQGAVNSLLLSQNATVGVLPALTANATPTAILCADAVNGSDANTGVAAGTYPNFTNCKQHLGAACTAMAAAGDILYAKGIFHDPTLGTSAVVSGTNVICTLPTTIGGASTAVPTTLTSYGPVLANDPYSGAAVGAWVDGADCIGQNTGDCAGQAAGPTWTLFSSANGVNIYTTPFTQQPVAMYIDNITTWPDGPNADGTTGLIEASCISGTCTNSVTSSANLTFWTATQTLAGLTCEQASVNNITQWFCASSGTGSSTAPSFQGTNTTQVGTTTFTDGTITWTFEGPSGGKIGAMTKGSWFWDGQKIYIATQQNDSPANHVVEAADHYQGIYMNANSAGANNWVISHMGIRHTQDGMLWRNNLNTTCLSGTQWLYNIIQQTGESNVDLANFCNGFRVVGADQTCTPTNDMVFQHNFMAYNGDHGGSTTVQAGADNMIINYNHYLHGNHASINLVGTGAVGLVSGTIQNNYIETDGPTGNQAVANDSVLGIFIGNGSNSNVVTNNYIHNMFGSYCVSGQCVCINAQGNSGNIIENNTCDQAEACLYTSSTTTLTYSGNICNNIVNYAATGYPVITHTGEIATADRNVETANTNVANISGVATNFATWNTDGFDVHGANANATFTPSDIYPWQLATGSVGVGMAATVGLYGVNAGANQAVQGLTQ